MDHVTPTLQSDWPGLFSSAVSSAKAFIECSFRRVFFPFQSVISVTSDNVASDKWKCHFLLPGEKKGKNKFEWCKKRGWGN